MHQMTKNYVESSAIEDLCGESPESPARRLDYILERLAKCNAFASDLDVRADRIVQRMFPAPELAECGDVTDKAVDPDGMLERLDREISGVMMRLQSLDYSLRQLRDL